ncbi:hypothetical protein/molybdenum cofactor cytidylyltransferase [Sanguibacter gelidistatuariae]|uniref:Uncharacterized protein n=1 Tax=Sanguibacter gelidistatuariae TaxID=1814289 RepID=A0A1G6GYP2_9MICO|nr:GNAT family N-acetyltransferase [Sanguibacter gelidistatuariae]SDB87119.1 hypothetical protein/molybdenum cofactor cytidylyltransferase [Sanguibacter gelidistatuariae]
MSGDTNGDTSGDDLSVRNDTSSQRFEAVTPDGQVAGFLAYDPVPAHVVGGHGLFVAIHTIVEPAWEGRGVAALLARTALDHARSQHLTVIAECPYVRAFVERHAEYQDLLP